VVGDPAGPGAGRSVGRDLSAFQHVLVEHVRNVLGVADAAHRESAADGTPVITLLACSLMGRTIDVVLIPGTRLAALHPGVSTAKERTTCNCGLDAGCCHVASSGRMVVSG
jgi:CTP synthase (UTP-ammonia lyase)